MFGRKEQDVKTTDRDASEEHAYEDNWYRSLKALAEQRNGPSIDEDGLEFGSETPAPPVQDAGTGVAVAHDGGPAEGAPPQGPTDPIPPAELETRAGQLLERLRTLQGLGGQEADGEAPPPPQPS